MNYLTDIIKGMDIKIYDVDIETGTADFEVGIKSSRNVDQIEMVLLGIEKLIRSIDLRADYNHDHEAYSQALKRILFAVADNYAFNGGHYSVHTEINNDKGYVTDKGKLEALRTLIK